MFVTIKEDILNDSKDKSDKFRTLFRLIIVCALSILVFFNIFQNDYVTDDYEFFFNWPAAITFNVPKLLTGSYPVSQHKVYRPVKGLIFATEYKFFNANRDFYHLQAILLNLAASILVYFIVRRISGKDSIAFISSLLFGIHPVHTEAITFMTASLDSIGILFFFLAFYFYIKSEEIKRYLIPSFIFAFLAFFTYELTLTLLLVIVVYDLVFKNINKNNFRSKIIIYSPFLLLSFLLLIFRIYFVGNIGEGGYFAGSAYLTFLTMTKAFFKYLELFIYPVNLSTNPVVSGGIQAYINSFTNLAPIQKQSIFDLDVIYSIFAIIGLLSLAFYFLKKRPVISFSIFFIFIAFLPVLNVFPQKLIMAERYAYIPSLGFVFMVGYVFEYLYNHKHGNIRLNSRQNFLIIFLILYVSVLSFLTIKRNFDWKNTINYSLALVNQRVGGSIGNYYLGTYYFQMGDLDRAEDNFKQIIYKRGDIKLAQYFIALIDIRRSIILGDKQKALMLYKNAYRVALPEDKPSLRSLKKTIDTMP